MWLDTVVYFNSFNDTGGSIMYFICKINGDDLKGKIGGDFYIKWAGICLKNNSL